MENVQLAGHLRALMADMIDVSEYGDIAGSRQVAGMTIAVIDFGSLGELRVDASRLPPGSLNIGDPFIAEIVWDR